MRRLLTAILLTLAALPAFALTKIEERCTADSLRYKGVYHTFWVYVPQTLSAEAPLLLVLHGYGGRAVNCPSALMDLADKEGFVVCYPQGLKDPKGKRCWNVGYPSQEGYRMDDVGFLEKLVRHLQKSYGLDTRNAFLSGMSNGGEMCYLMARRKPELFAGIISIAGLTLECMEPLNYRGAVPFMEVHGTSDKTSYWTGDHENKYGWGAYLSVPAAISYVVSADGCKSYSKEDLTAEGCKPVFLHRYYDGERARKGKGHECEVWLYEVVGGGHSWAEKNMDTFAQMWKFMDTFLYR